MFCKCGDSQVLTATWIGETGEWEGNKIIEEIKTVLLTNAYGFWREMNYNTWLFCFYIFLLLSLINIHISIFMLLNV